jgi:hypothetical protein
MLKSRAGDDRTVAGRGFDGGANFLGVQEDFCEPAFIEVTEPGAVPEVIRNGEVDKGVLAAVGQALAFGGEGFGGFTHRPPPRCR